MIFLASPISTLMSEVDQYDAISTSTFIFLYNDTSVIKKNTEIQERFINQVVQKLHIGVKGAALRIYFFVMEGLYLGEEHTFSENVTVKGLNIV